MSASSPGRADSYIRFYETMTQDSLTQLPDLVTHDVQFADPFNDVRGVAALQRVMLKTMHDLPDQRFVVTRRAWDGDLCLMCWRFEGHTKGGQHLSITGMSELTFAADGKVARHIDHWDAATQFYEKLPLLGGILRFIRRRIAA